MQTKAKPTTNAASVKRDANAAALLTLLNEGNAAEVARLLRRLADGRKIDSELTKHDRRRKRWDYFKRVARWAFGEEDRELDRMAGIE